MQVFARHSILRSTVHSAGLPHAVQMVHAHAEPEWQFRAASGAAPEEVIAAILREDSARSNNLSEPLPARITLAALQDGTHFFLLSIPDLQLDGWSWPVIFGDAARAYAHPGEALPEARPYGDYLRWLALQDDTASVPFWKLRLANLPPTLAPGNLPPVAKPSRRFRRDELILTEEESTTLTHAAKRWSISPAILVQTAWALLLSRHTGQNEVVFGSSFSGRPSDLDGADRIVGPFVNNLPLRISCCRDSVISSLFQSVQGQIFDLLPHQQTPLAVMQDAAGIPWNRRLFESLVVFQNYRGGEEAMQLGEARLSQFTGPIHTAYPCALVVTPRAAWELLLVTRDSDSTPAHCAAILQEVRRLLLCMCCDHPQTVHEVLQDSLIPAVGCHAALPVARAAVRTAPRTDLEKRIAGLWQRAFGISDPAIEDNIFDLGGNSLLMVRLHQALREELGLNLSLIDLFRYPSIQSLIQFLTPASPTSVAVAPAVQNRAAAARAAAAKARDARSKTTIS